MKERHRESGRVYFSGCCVLDAPPGIPDGSYAVFFEGHRVRAVRQGGLWLPEERAELLTPEERFDELQEEPSFRMEDAIAILPLLKNEAA
ncbi:MAG TPA: hypothetical protein VHX13_05745 [Acidobacteriaceae bacterium]|nr:hypothetical protein [Acidobacteriaceae bacterium]